MPAPRYHDWHHTRFEGDRASCARYLPFGRKVLGYVVEQARQHGLTNYSVRKPILDGDNQVGEVVAELYASQPRLTIRVFGAGEQRPERFRFAGFVAWPRNADFPDGFNTEHPQVGFFTRREDEWATLYFNQDDPPWNAVESPKGTYRLLSNGEPMFPLGLNESGNIDWIGPEGKLQLNWYGPRGRYHPTYSDQLRKLIFYRGKLLLDLEAYAAAHGRSDVDAYVMGAAIKDGRLYVITTSDYGYRDDASATHKMIRFDLAPGDAADGLQRLVVLEDETEAPATILWTATRDRSPAPYFFNASVTKACRVGYKPGTNNDDENELATLTIDADDNVSMATEPANITTNISFTQIFPPVTSPGELYFFRELVEPATMLVGRDFLGDTQKDVIFEFRSYSSEDKCEQDGSTFLSFSEIYREFYLKVGSTEFRMWNQHTTTPSGTFGPDIPKPPQYWGFYDVHYIITMDARFDAVATAHILENMYGNSWVNFADIEQVACECETAVFFNGVKHSYAARSIPLQAYDAAGDALDEIIGGLLWGKHGPVSFVDALVEAWTHIGTFTQGHDSFMTAIDRWLSIESSDWFPGINTDHRDFTVQGSLPCLREPSTFLFAGVDAFHPSDSIAQSPDFEPFDRSANNGPSPSLHPAWALQTIETAP